MVITDVNQVVYQGDGATTAFPFTFRIIDATDIKLLLIDADGAEIDITSDYFVDTVNNTVHYPGYAPGAEPPEADRPAPVQTGQRLVVYRELPITQEKDLGDKWPFFVIELALDKLTMILQQIYGWWNRAFKISEGTAASKPDFDLTVPIEAGKTFRVKEDGTGFEITDDPKAAREAAEAAQEAAERAQGIAENARDDAEAAAAQTKLQAVWFDDGTELRTTDIPVGMTAGTKGYFAANDGGNAVYIIRAKRQEDVDDGGSIIFLENGNVAELITDGTVNVKQFGAVGDGVTDDTAAFRASINSGYNVYVPKGHYILTEEIENTTGLTMYGDGDESILDYGDSLPSGRGLTISGSLTELPNISDASKGDTTVTFASAHGLSVGDVFCIYNPTDYSWSGWRAYYKAGEWCQVNAVNGNTVTVSNPLYDSYLGADVEVWKMNSVPVDLHDFRIIGTSTFGLLKVVMVKKFSISNISSNLEKYDCVYIDRCYEGVISNLHLHNLGTNDNDYGLIIGNSQRITVIGGYYYARRHGIATGGTVGTCCVPCRQLYFNNVIFDNDHSLKIISNGLHGNIEDAVFDNCVFYNSVGTAGRDVTIQNSRIIGVSQVSVVHIVEPNGGNHVFQNNEIYTSSNTTNLFGEGWVHFTNLSDSIKDSSINVIFRNNILNITKSVNDQVFMSVINLQSAYTGKINLVIDGLELIGNSGSIRFIVIEKANSATTDNSDHIIVDNIKGNILSNSYFVYSSLFYMYTVPMRLMKQNGKEQVTIPSGSMYAVGSLTDLKIAYPTNKTPVGLVSAISGSFVGASLVIATFHACTFNQVRMTLFTHDSANVSADVTKDVSWEVSVNEV